MKLYRVKTKRLCPSGGSTKRGHDLRDITNSHFLRHLGKLLRLNCGRSHGTTAGSRRIRLSPGMDQLDAYLSTLFMHGSGNGTHFIRKVVYMDTHLSGKLFAVQPDKGITADYQTDPSPGKFPVVICKSLCRAAVRLTHPFPCGRTHKSVTDCHAVDRCLVK